MKQDTLIQLGLLIFTGLGFFILWKQNKSTDVQTAVNEQLEEYEQYASIKESLVKLEAEHNALKDRVESNTCDIKRIYDNIDKSLSQLHEKLNQHLENYHIRGSKNGN